MLRKLTDLRGYAIRATDGFIGTVSNFYLMTRTGVFAIWSSTPATGCPEGKC